MGRHYTVRAKDNGSIIKQQLNFRRYYRTATLWISEKEGKVRKPPNNTPAVLSRLRRECNCYQQIRSSKHFGKIRHLGRELGARQWGLEGMALPAEKYVPQILIEVKGRYMGVRKQLNNTEEIMISHSRGSPCSCLPFTKKLCSAFELHAWWACRIFPNQGCARKSCRKMQILFPVRKEKGTQGKI